MQCNAYVQVTQNKQEFAQGRVFFTAFTDACKEKKYRDTYAYCRARLQRPRRPAVAAYQKERMRMCESL